MLGNRTLQNQKFDSCLKTEVVDNVTVTTALWKLFCESAELNATCDQYFDNNNVKVVQGIPGLTSGVISGVNFIFLFCCRFDPFLSLFIVLFYFLIDFSSPLL